MMELYSIVIDDKFAEEYYIINEYARHNKYLGTYDSKEKAVNSAIHFIKDIMKNSYGENEFLLHIIRNSLNLNYPENISQIPLGIEIYKVTLNTIDTNKECTDMIAYIPKDNKITAIKRHY